MTFVAAAHTDATSATSVAPAVPTGTADGDILFAVLSSGVTTEADPGTVPTGWTKVGSMDPDVSTMWLYYKIASGESGSYTWDWGVNSRRGATVVAYRSGFSVGSLTDMTISNTKFITNNTTVRGAGITVPDTNSPMIGFWLGRASTTETLTTPTVPTGWATDVNDLHAASTSRLLREVCSFTWSSSGATGDMDSTCSVAFINKHAFVVALKPAAAGTTNPKGPLSNPLAGPFGGPI